MLQEGQLSKELSELRGLGPRSVLLLARVGITSVESLFDVGSVNAYERLVRAGIPVSLNMLWALEGACSDRDWRDVSREDRTRLLWELDRRGIAP